MRRLRFPVGVGLAALVIAGAPACGEFETKRKIPERNSLGEEMYGVLCDRMGAQAFQEDLTGASFRNVCHRDKNGEYADEVDFTKLPSASQDQKDVDGKLVTAAEQEAYRKRAAARLQALAKRRSDLVVALDAVFPDVEMPVRRLGAANPKESCEEADKEGRFHDELAGMLGRLTDLYHDGSLPESTQSLAVMLRAFQESKEAKAAWTRMNQRLGYRPIETGFGALRPLVTYPGLRDLSHAMRVLTDDANPYAPERGPGSGHAALVSSLEVIHQELVHAKQDPVAPALVVTPDPQTGKARISRPRDNVEFVSALFGAPADMGLAPRYIVKRDHRGYASVAKIDGKLPAPFLDNNNDGLADIDAFGRFVTEGGQKPPTPFFTVQSPDAVTRDPFGRPQMGSTLVYDYVDTTATMGGSLFSEMKGLMSPDDQREPLMDMLAGLGRLLGTRDGGPKTTHTYPDNQRVTYDAFHPENSPLIDLLYAFGQLLGDRSMDDTLQVLSALFQDHPGEVARVAGALLKAKDIANAHPEASLPANSTLWDELLDTAVKIAKKPGLLEDLLQGMAHPQSERLGSVYASFMKFSDRVSYDRNNLNGPVANLTTGRIEEPRTPVDRSKAATGDARSEFHRFLELMAQSAGVATCNKADTILYARGAVPGGLIKEVAYPKVFRECELFKIDNLAAFYLRSIVGRSELFLRPKSIREGLVLEIGATTVDIMQQSSGITGFWDAPDSRTIRPKPEWLNRLCFFDMNDSRTEGSPNYITNKFLNGVGFTHGAASCAERVITDPDPGAKDAARDGMVHGLRACQSGEWLNERFPDTIFTWENFGFYPAMAPTLDAFAKNNAEDLFLEITNHLYAHWPDQQASERECAMSSDPNALHTRCLREGAVRYEPLLAEMLGTDLMPAISNIVRAAGNIKIKHCDARDPNTGACTSATETTGFQVLANATRRLLDPELAKQEGLKDRRGGVTGARNDGTQNAQVSPIYLITGALNAIDASLDDAQKAQWRRGRGHLADYLLRTEGAGVSAKFGNTGLMQGSRALVELLRSQLLAHCPKSFTPPFERCAWAKDELVKKVSESISGPLFSTTMDLLEAVRRDDDARVQMQRLMQYMAGRTTDSDALASTVASLEDLMQILRDEENLVPLLHVMGKAMAPTVRDADGKVTQRNMAEAQLGFLSHVGMKRFDSDGDEICRNEIDPNNVLRFALKNLVAPMKNEAGVAHRTPLDVIIDVISEVNRVSPGEGAARYEEADYTSIADNLIDFLTNKERGIEQFYEIVRQGTPR